MFYLSARNSEKKTRKELQMTWLGAAEVQLGLAHRTVRWCTRQCLVRQVDFRWTSHSREKSAAYDYNSPDCPMVHRTVRWANGQPRNSRATRGPRQRSAGAPDYLVCTGQCPVHHLARRCNGCLHQNRKEIDTGPSTVTVRWHTGLSSAPPDRRQG
jgi:hypothetical protein